MNGALNPVWISVGIGALSAIGCALASYFGTKIALARVEERQKSLGDGMSRLTRVTDEHGRYIGDHSTRLRVLENEMDLRPPPVDYVR